MREGDEQALGVFYDRWQGVVRAVAVRIVREPAEAEDVVEEVFWQAWRQAERFDSVRGGASTWLLTIARSRALDRARSLARVRSDVAFEEEGPDAGAIATATAYEPADLAEQSEVRSRVQAAMGTLPPEQRLVVELGYFEGLSQSEIAERTGEALGTVKTRTRLAMRKLRDLLAPLGPEEVRA